MDAIATLYEHVIHVLVEINFISLEVSSIGKFITLYGDSVLVMAKLQLSMYAHALGSACVLYMLG